MLSFESVLDCFAPVIQAGICEVLLTRHGYVAMEWDEEEREWFNVTHCDTPEALPEAILFAYEGYLQLSLVMDYHAPSEEEIFWRFMTDFSFLVCHNKCVSMLKRSHTKINVLRKIFAGHGVYKADDVFRRAYCYLFLTCTGGTVWTSSSILRGITGI